MITQTRESLGGIFTFLCYFVLGETGFVRKESGFAAAWIVGVLIAGAVLLGAPQKAVADGYCGGNHWPCDTLPGHCQTWCWGQYECSVWYCDIPTNYCHCWSED